MDIFPPPTTWIPPNCVFEVDDVLREWTWKEPFDFIHMRLMCGALSDEGWEQLYKQIYEWVMTVPRRQQTLMWFSSL